MSHDRSPADGTDVGTVDADGDDRASIQKDDAFHVLQNGRRRAVLRYMLDHDGREQFRMRDLAEEVAAWEHDTTVRKLTSNERQRVYIALYQSHLPKLDEYGVIDYNQSRGIIEPTQLVEVFAPLIPAGLHSETDTLTLSEDDQTADSLSSHRLVGALSTLLAD